MHFDICDDVLMCEQTVVYLRAAVFHFNFHHSFHDWHACLSYKALSGTEGCSCKLPNKSCASLRGKNTAWPTLCLLRPKTLRAACRMSREELKWMVRLWPSTAPTATSSDSFNCKMCFLHSSEDKECSLQLRGWVNKKIKAVLVVLWLPVTV